MDCTQMHRYHGIIQKKSVSGSQMLPCLVILFGNFILICKCQKGSLNRGTLVSAPAIYQTKCPFTVLSALFLFFWMLPYDSKLFPGYRDNIQTNRWTQKSKNLNNQHCCCQCLSPRYRVSVLSTRCGGCHPDGFIVASSKIIR